MRRLALLVVAGVGVSVGSAAFAADMPLPPGPPPAVPYLPVVPPFSWTGFYIGGNLGLGWSQGSFSDPAGNSLGLPNNARLLGGGQVGFNFEYYGGFVIGAEADFDWFANSNTIASNPVPLIDNFGNPTGSTATIAIDNKWLTTVAGRLGYAFDRVLLYGKGGAAWAGDKYTVTGSFAGTGFGFEGLEARTGWTAGAGVEWAFYRHWSASLEYDFYQFGHRTTLMSDTINGFTGNMDAKQSVQVVKLGVNFHMWSSGW